MELARVTQDLVRMEARCQALEDEMQADATTYRLQTHQGLAIEQVLEWQARMDSQQAALTQAHQAVGALTEAWNRTQARLVEASQERKMLDRLAERQQQAHRTKVRRREQLVLDEAAYRQHASIGKRAS